ncbi:glyoxalase/bleomycin resistance/extradiol dioxygenase family protein [Mesorhizobium sp. B2-3-11]|uniref:glyoxalase/bleomycin resistance/extradiol dioxygenase family protein n=1 Tax=Mesorhizobium sp. B2-3-11 TaxID=2589953 RepID=UPI001129DCBE|nr:glyoxalase/bleomycin resistance/extradiol dioxygenase family protein [Mesorhizobium sp. B2-3-11]TPL97017.1 glyoxalase/bleomycin resistance/extradiol dioxygenase family protein [Mesorhizobium sp. B2-3-11]
MRLSPSLFFTTNCEPALAFYEQCGLGRATILLRWGDNNMPVRTEAMRGKVLHARFEGPGVLFHASDNDDAEPMKGSAMMLEFDRPIAAPGVFAREELFAHMAEGGRITVPFARQYWGTSFGMLVDAFGVQWMFSCSKE